MEDGRGEVAPAPAPRRTSEGRWPPRWGMSPWHEGRRLVSLWGPSPWPLSQPAAPCGAPAFSAAGVGGRGRPEGQRRAGLVHAVTAGLSPWERLQSTRCQSPLSLHTLRVESRN